MHSFSKGLLLTTFAAGLGLAQVPDFIPPVVYPTGGSSTYAAVADFNGDGLRDIAAVEGGTLSLSILFSNGDGSLQPPVTRGIGFIATSIAAADLNGDGKPDLVMSTPTAVAVMINAGDGTFQAPAFYVPRVTPNYAACADLNNDGKMDIVIAGANGFSVMLGVGNGTFTQQMPAIPELAASFYLLLADFNNDGNIDLLADNGHFYAGKGNGLFADPTITMVVPWGSAVGDFNNDGKLDVAYMGALHRQDGDVQYIGLALGTGTGVLNSYYQIVPNGGRLGQPVVGDFNGDGFTDVAFTMGSPAGVAVLRGTGTLSPQWIPPVSTPALSGTLVAGDLDGNGSPDLFILSPATVTLLRNTHGNPPLLAQISLNPPSVIGGAAMTQGTATLGGPAPAVGAVVTLSSSNPAIASPTVPSVTIPAGASSATFDVSTAAVASATTVTISGTSAGVTQNATLNLVAPYGLAALSIAPASQYGIFTAQGVVTLSGPADSAAVVSLASSNPALASVPASVTVPAGATTATFTIVLQPVAANTVVPISAFIGAASQSAAVTILKPADSVQISRADDVVSKFQLRVEATSTSSTATVTVWNTATGTLIGTLANNGGGKYSNTFTTPTVATITLKSSLGGTTTGAVNLK